jgi:hypothetical protein
MLEPRVIFDVYGFRLFGGQVNMGKTVPSFRMQIEDEISSWRGFAVALRVEERQAFEALMDTCRNYSSACSNATKPVIFEPMALSILLYQQMRIVKLEREIDALKGKQ